MLDYEAPAAPPIAAHVGQYSVLATRHEVLWPDGTSVQLHPVLHHGAPHRSMRGLQLAGAWRLVDLQRVAPAVARDLPAAPARDQVGVVFYGLRLSFPNAEAFRAAAAREVLHG